MTPSRNGSATKPQRFCERRDLGLRAQGSQSEVEHGRRKEGQENPLELAVWGYYDTDGL